MDRPSLMSSSTSGLAQSLLSSHRSDDDLYLLIGTEQYADQGPMEVEPVEQSPTRSLKSDSSLKSFIVFVLCTEIRNKLWFYSPRDYP
jgi:hypothetical protein